MVTTAAPQPADASRVALYVRATRPLYLPTSGIPALVGAVVAIGNDAADWWLAAVAVIAVLLVHCGVNVINDVEDFARGVDTAEKMDNSRVFTTGLLSVSEGRLLALGYFAAGTLLGLIAVAAHGPQLLVVGIAGVLGGWLYTGGPRPYKHLGLGDPAIILLMGPFITQGAYTAVTGDGFDAAAFFVGFCPGLLIAAVLQGNNLSDIVEDGRAGVRTLAVRMGFGPARALYLASLTLAYAVLPLAWAFGLFGPWILLPLVTVPLALPRIQQARAGRGPGDDGLRTLAPQTAQLHLLTSLLLTAAVILDRSF
jgi:1,4-dihydroxy-2-naphthoate polyprenyltransferase